MEKPKFFAIDLFRPRFPAFVSLVGNDSLCSAFDVALNVVGCACIACIIEMNGHL